MGVVTNIRDFLSAAREAVAPIVNWITRNVELQDVLIALAAAIGSVVLPVLWTISQPILAAMGVFTAVMAIVAALRSAWESNFLGIQQKTQAVIQFVQNVIQSGLAAVQGFWQAHGQQITAAATTAWQAVRTAVGTAITAVQSVIQTVVGAIQTLWANHGVALTTAARNTWQMIQSVINRVITIIQSVVQFFLAGLRGDFEAQGEALRTIWDNLWGIIGDIVSTAVENIITMFGDVDWAQVGKNVVQGIAKGISAAAGLIADAAKRAARAAFQAAKGVLGIRSPSRLFEEEIGEPMVAGWIQPLLDTRAIERGVQQMARVSLSVAQQRPAVAAAGLGGGGRGGAAWRGDINIYGARDPHQAADAVIQALQDRGIMPSTLLR
jgi:phage-related protein